MDNPIHEPIMNIILDIVSHTTLSDGNVIINIVIDHEAYYCITVYSTILHYNNASHIYHAIRNTMMECGYLYNVCYQQNICLPNQMNILEKMLQQHVSGVVFEWTVNEIIVSYVEESRISNIDVQ